MRLSRGSSVRVGLALAFAGWPGASRAADAPDLVPKLPAAPYDGQVAPVYMDAFTEPGRLLYRFDAILENRGGTLDVFRDAGSGHAMQAVWDGGTPSTQPDPNQPPPAGPDVTIEDRSAAGASFFYVFEPDHDHWHFGGAARYELLLPEGGSRASDKVGFCLFDTFDTEGEPLYFPPGYQGSGSQTWCGFDHPDGEFVRMGLSPGAADRYRSQRHFQWVDVTGLAPGAYTLRATANPAGYLVEADGSNNVVDQPRSVPGAIASAVSASAEADAEARIPLRGEVVAPEVPARRSAACDPAADDDACYVWASVDGPLSFRIAEPPAGGDVTLEAGAGTQATAVYRSRANFTGGDGFSYTVTDARGLESPPARVQVRVTGPASLPAARRRRLVSRAAVRRRGGRWYVVLRLSRRATVGVRIVRRGRLVRRLSARRLGAGRRTIGLGRLRRAGRYIVRLHVRSAGATQVVRLRITRRRSAPRPARKLP